jgi:hypothetical protein
MMQQPDGSRKENQANNGTEYLAQYRIHSETDLYIYFMVKNDLNFFAINTL